MSSPTEDETLAKELSDAFDAGLGSTENAWQVVARVVLHRETLA